MSAEAPSAAFGDLFSADRRPPAVRRRGSSKSGGRNVPLVLCPVPVVVAFGLVLAPGASRAAGQTTAPAHVPPLKGRVRTEVPLRWVGWVDATDWRFTDEDIRPNVHDNDMSMCFAQLQFDGDGPGRLTMNYNRSRRYVDRNSPHGPSTIITNATGAWSGEINGPPTKYGALNVYANVYHRRTSEYGYVVAYPRPREDMEVIETTIKTYYDGNNRLVQEQEQRKYRRSCWTKEGPPTAGGVTRDPNMAAGMVPRDLTTGGRQINTSISWNLHRTGPDDCVNLPGAEEPTPLLDAIAHIFKSQAPRYDLSNPKEWVRVAVDIFTATLTRAAEEGLPSRLPAEPPTAPPGRGARGEIPPVETPTGPSGGARPPTAYGARPPGSGAPGGAAPSGGTPGGGPPARTPPGGSSPSTPGGTPPGSGNPGIRYPFGPRTPNWNWPWRLPPGVQLPPYLQGLAALLRPVFQQQAVASCVPACIKMVVATVTGAGEKLRPVPESMFATVEGGFPGTDEDQIPSMLRKWHVENSGLEKNQTLEQLTAATQSGYPAIVGLGGLGGLGGATRSSSTAWWARPATVG